MAILSPKPDPHVFAGRLVPLATDRMKEKIAMSHILVAGGGLNPCQINAVKLATPLLAGGWRRFITRLLRASA
jgi:hypothetical protein